MRLPSSTTLCRTRCGRQYLVADWRVETGPSTLLRLARMPKLVADNRRFATFRNNRTRTYVMIGIVGVAITLAFGFNPAFLLVLAICPLMMFFKVCGRVGGY